MVVVYLTPIPYLTHKHMIHINLVIKNPISIFPKCFPVKLLKPEEGNTTAIYILAVNSFLDILGLIKLSLNLMFSLSMS